EKSNYSLVLDYLKDISSLITTSTHLEPGIVDVKNQEDLVYADFSNKMEDVQRKLVYVDKTLFGE
ncbi:hypothetical protein KY321_03700, partial [Candidatus Woesearchaeota archaeon]|nr:hypothetical protein [Candidatus Woesearchaeota archaeon]